METTNDSKKARKREISQHNSSNAIYGLGFIGAVIYFVSQSTTFWSGILGFLKAIIWPAFLVYYLLEYLGM